MNLFLLIYLIIFDNNSLAEKEFCLYGYEGITKVVDPYYINSNNETVYFESIEEYSNFAGPIWFDVSFCGNNTVVNNVGQYFEYNKSNKKRSSSTQSKIKTFKNFVKRDNNDNIYNLSTEEEFSNYYKSLYDNLINRKNNSSYSLLLEMIKLF